MKKGECIHHIDFNKKNNKIENLMLFKSNSAHQKFHIKIRQFGITNPILRQIKNRWDGLLSERKHL
ncbi:HNH endonuclease [candidate division KSB1 bacterium]|nr:HNH endonuclease [candidate division KSB1 bacterium]